MGNWKENIEKIWHRYGLERHQLARFSLDCIEMILAKDSGTLSKPRCKVSRASRVVQDCTAPELLAVYGTDLERVRCSSKRSKHIHNE